MTDRKLRRRAVWEILGFVSLTIYATISALGVWPVRLVPWWLFAIVAASCLGWLFGVVQARPDLFDEVTNA